MTIEERTERNSSDIASLKIRVSNLESSNTDIRGDIQDLKVSDSMQDKEIESLKGTLKEIKDDTNWIRRKITGAIITAMITAVVGGVIGIIITQIFN